ncbi:nitrilase-related carbon-nitrogen hydrolase [Patulibacter sp.]|uniref:nitrilase-related carbon-nitrogen hydrolase n=1 Tax=Patulibacter sp. TaxID=1912859 RepID=UPI002718922E|nr:nitrilase-related carbon-nitrogen hydrolase [Patulibacter sp.]MDO9408366.1 nitrilase-related carbon-nitrogen hydrolase [Patulibacter sp.]
MTRIACQQLAPRIADLDHNRAQARTAIREAVDAGAQVVVLPELVTSGYVFASKEEAAGVAVTPEHELFGEWSAEAERGGAVVVGGFCEAGPDGTLFNSAALVDRAGVVAVYRKTHLWDREKLVFSPGAQAPVVVDTAVGRIGVVVCYDMEFPEMTRGLALAGCELLAVPTNWPLVPRPDGERAPEVVVGMGTARVNRMAIACCDRAGVERGQEWNSGTSIIDADGWVVAERADAGLLLADVDLEPTRSKRLTEHADLHGDRRPELYGSIVAPRTARAADGD